MSGNDLATHKKILNNFIKEYEKDDCEFWLRNMKEAIGSVLYLMKEAEAKLNNGS